MTGIRRTISLSVAIFLFGSTYQDSSAQSPLNTRPAVGLRKSEPTLTALTGATVRQNPQADPIQATVLIDGNRILDVGPNINIPPDARQIDCTGQYLYPGLIDAYSETDVDWSSDQQAGGYWNRYVTPRRNADDGSVVGSSAMQKLRQQGIAIRLVAPAGRIVKGRSVLRLMTDDEPQRQILSDPHWVHVQLTVPRQRLSGETYPNSPMGATSLVRQTFYDADWYEKAWAAYQADRTLPRPERNSDLETLVDQIDGCTFVFDAPNERMAVRADKIAREFSLKAIIHGSGREYRAIDDIAASGRPILIPVDFPDKPDVSMASAQNDMTLQTLLHWHHAPGNPGRLSAAGVPFCLTTDGLDDGEGFLKAIRQSIEHGLDESAALAAVTTVPAQWLGITDDAGTIEAGKLANLFLTDQPWDYSDAKVIRTFVAGKSFWGDRNGETNDDPLPGRWTASGTVNGRKTRFVLTIKRDKRNRWSAQVQKPATEKAESEPASDDEKASEPKPVSLDDVRRNQIRLTGTIDQANFAKVTSTPLQPGTALLELITFTRDDASKVDGTLVTADGRRWSIRMQPAAIKDAAEKQDGGTSSETATESVAAANGKNVTTDDIPLLHPLGAYGTTGLPDQPPEVLLTGATVWTCADDDPKVQDVLIRDGKIAAVGTDLKTTDNVTVVSCDGKHITPGIIDCHSHIATDGGVNESGQAVTAEVRIGDFIDDSDITIFRHLAGGVTTANILHGSANPIGGQNQVIKMRWGGRMDQLRFKDAPAGIKFALGENVKRNPGRYPNTRMGVQEIIRDQLLAARQYDHRRRSMSDPSTHQLPVRRDLQLDALSQVQRGERWIHCHSYRQDEILATLSLLEEFGIQIGTLQHILEGYKVADAMKRHGAMGSSFSDWWAYKFEVYDAIPYNGVLMNDADVVVSYNSDDAELGRHLNTEAAKATKYGDVAATQALRFVTLHPARQLRIDDRVGSIESGKDADLVIWSGPPLSTTTRCEQTWIDGRCYFSLDKEAQWHQRDQTLRQTLIQKVLADGKPSGDDPDGDNTVAEEDRWLRYDAFCTTRQQ
ncbi:isoaspartyl dipeptidase [Crateriforma conspicua]|uniref:Isoaspartyl dipeptidase n=1 Tax=Crateriforma conspicua TaxID=2527996 RepID=A0A5C6FNX3_9PLAN|nr:isoaspartyl dipeptidase [Crateriforma conspicua]